MRTDRLTIDRQRNSLRTDQGNRLQDKAVKERSLLNLFELYGRCLKGLQRQSNERVKWHSKSEEYTTVLWLLLLADLKCIFFMLVHSLFVSLYFVCVSIKFVCPL